LVSICNFMHVMGKLASLFWVRKSTILQSEEPDNDFRETKNVCKETRCNLAETRYNQPSVCGAHSYLETLRVCVAPSGRSRKTRCLVLPVATFVFAPP
jgi:hypothetical protein